MASGAVDPRCPSSEVTRPPSCMGHGKPPTRANATANLQAMSIRMAPAEGDGVAREAAAHVPLEAGRATPDQEVGVGREQGPGVDGEGPLRRQAGQPRNEVGADPIVAKETRTLDPPQHHVVDDIRGIETGLAGHGTS